MTPRPTITLRTPPFCLLFAALLSLTLTASVYAQPRLGVTRMSPELQQELGLQGGAPIYQVITASAAGKAGIEPGDIITQANGKTIADFAALAEIVLNQQIGNKLPLKLMRDGKELTIDATLTLWTGDLDRLAYEKTLAWLESKRGTDPGPQLRMALIENQFAAGKRDAALSETTAAAQAFENQTAFVLKELELLQKTGRYDEYITKATAAAKQHPNELQIQAAYADALLAIGKNAEAEKVADRVGGTVGFLQMSLSPANAEGILMWANARLRQNKGFQDGQVANILERYDLSSVPELAAVKFWKQQLGKEKSFVVEGPAQSKMPLQSTQVLLGLVPNRMHGISLKINGIDVPLAIVDTGASHTIVNTWVAEQAGIPVGTASREAAGSLKFQARSGFIKEMQIGDHVIRNIPISVGNPPPLVMTNAKMALGVDLMQHLRFTIDYPEKQVIVEKADAETKQPEPAKAAIWDIPMYTFADHVLEQGELPDGRKVRVLIDSGNFAQTLVWPTWAQGVIPNHPGVTSSILTYAMTNPQHSLRGLKLGGRTLPDWPVMDMPPVTFGDIDLLDVLMGHDLLSQYRVTIDMANRRLRLVSPSDRFKVPVPPRPFGI